MANITTTVMDAPYSEADVIYSLCDNDYRIRLWLGLDSLTLSIDEAIRLHADLPAAIAGARALAAKAAAKVTAKAAPGA